MHSLNTGFPTTSNNVPSLSSLNTNTDSKNINTTTSGPSTNNVTASRIGGGGNNYTNYETNQTTSTTSTYGGMFSTGSKSPTNATTTTKEPSKYAQYIPREIPLRSNNLNPTSKIENTSNPYTIDPTKKKEINITSTTPDVNYMMKNKFTPTSNITTGGMSGISAGGGKLYVPTGDLRKPTDPYSSNTKPMLSKPGLTYTSTTTGTKPLSRK